MRNFQTDVIKKIKTHVLYSATFSENRAFCEITWKNIVQPGRLKKPQKKYVILIAFPQQQYLQDGASVLLSYVHCLSSSHKSRYFPLCQ